MNTISRSIAALAVILCLGCPPLSPSAVRADSTLHTHVAAPPCQHAQEVATVRVIRHGLSIRRKGRREKTRRHMALLAGDVAETRAGERAALTLCDGSTLTLNEKSATEVRSRQLAEVRQGEAAEQVKKGATQRLESAAARATMRGGKFDVRVQGSRSSFVVVRGTLLVRNGHGEVKVAGNQQTVVLPDQAPPRPTRVDAGRALAWTTSVTGPFWTVFATFDPSYSPYRLEVNAQGDVYVENLPTAFESIVELSPSGKQLRAWGLHATDGDLNGLALDTQSNVYVTDRANAAIEKFTPDGRFLTTIGAFRRDLNLGLAGVEVDSAGNIYVAEANNNQVDKLSPSGQKLLVVGGSGTVPGRLNGPTDIALDKAGNFYVTENVNGRVQKFSPAGRAIRTFGTGQIELPTDVALDAAGNIYVCEPPLERIDEFSPTGQTLKPWRILDANVGSLDGPYGVALDAAGNMYVADYSNHRIVKLIRH